MVKVLAEGMTQMIRRKQWFVIDLGPSEPGFELIHEIIHRSLLIITHRIGKGCNFLLGFRIDVADGITMR